MLPIAAGKKKLRTVAAEKLFLLFIFILRRVM